MLLIIPRIPNTEKSPSFHTTGFISGNFVKLNYTARSTLPLRRQRVQT